MLNRKKLTNVFSIILILFFMIMFSFNCYASNLSWWRNAYNFSNNVTSDVFNVSALNDIMGIIEFVGNIIFIIVTTILGVKYIWGGVESKASVKDSLITLVVAAMFFYGWTTIRALFVQNDQLIFLTNNYQVTAKSIYSTVLYILNFLAIGGIVYIGIRYLMAGAEGKANLKANGVSIILGIMMVYGTITFLNFILKITGV